MKKKMISLLMILTLGMSLITPVSFAAVNENLFINPGFEELLHSGGWGSILNADYKRVKDNPHGGEYCVEATYDMATESWIQDIRLTPGETYDFSMWARVEKGKGELKALAYFNYGYAYDAFNNKEGQIAVIQGVMGESWTQIKGSFTYTGINSKGIEVDDNVQFALRFSGKYKEKPKVYIDDFSLIPQGKSKQESKRMPDEFKWEEDPLAKPKEMQTKNFEDTENHWAKTTIDSLSAEGIINGVSETEFAPQSSVTRAEFITLLLKSFQINRDTRKSKFQDVSIDAWYAEPVMIAENIGLIPDKIIENKNLYPNKQLTRGEASAILSNYADILGKKAENKKASFDDVNTFGKFNEDIEKSASLGLINGYTDNTFKSSETISRAEAAEMVKNAIELNGRRYFYVDYEKGNDKNNGTYQAPFKTIYQAQKAVRENNDNMKGNIYVFLKSGAHYMEKTLNLTTEDSGTNGYNIIYTSYGEDKAILSGGESKVLDWQLYDEEKGIYSVQVGNVATRQMYVDGKRAVRAKSDGPLTKYSYSPGAEWPIATKSTWVTDLTNTGEIELVHNGSYYCNFRPMIKEIKLDGDIARIKLFDEFVNSNRKTNLYMSSNLWIENAYELLDEAGEWYWNNQNGYLYYKPRKWENLKTAEITLPKQEVLIEGKGTINDNTYEPIHNISFKNINFAYTTNYNSFGVRKGMALYQNAILREGDPAKNELNTSPNAAVSLDNTSYIDFEDCVFNKIGSFALKMCGGIQHININANHFYDISGNAIQMGELNTQNDNAFTPFDKRYYKADIHITNNYIHDTAKEYLSAGALAVTNLQYSEIKNNEIFRTSYSGMHLGYGFSSRAFSFFYDTPVTHNYIHKTNFKKYMEVDGGAIYHMSTTYGDLRDAQTSKGRNKISYNFVEDLGESVNAIYSDEGCSWVEISHNVFDHQRKTMSYGVFTTGNQSKYNIVTDNYIVKDTLSISDVVYEPFTEWYKESGGVIPDPDGQRLQMGTQIGPEYLLKSRDIKDWDQGALDIVENAGISKEYIDKFPEEFQDFELVYNDYGRMDNGKLHDDEYPAVYDMKSGETLKVEIKATNRKKTQGYISPDRIYFENNSPDIVEVLPDNTIKALKKGKADLFVEVLCGENKDVVETYPIEIYVDDEVHFRPDAQRYMFWHNGSMGIFKVQVDEPYKFELSFTTDLGRKILPKEVELSSDNPDIADFDEEGRVVGKKAGQGNIIIKMKWGGNNKYGEYSVPFTIIENEMYTDFDKSQIVEVDENFININNWSFIGNNSNSSQGDGNIKLNSDKLMVYNKETLDNKLIHFKMTVNHKAGWPSIALNCGDTTTNLNNEYILTFYNGSVEWQRYNNGKRSVLWGAGNMFDGTVEIYGGRPGIKFDYGTEYDVGVGAFSVDNGVRVVLYLNGLKVFDQIDYINNEKYKVSNAPVLTNGYFGIHSTESGGSNITLGIPNKKK